VSLFFEDFEVGQVREFGRETVSREEIVDFARSFDPQPFHVDEEAARASPYGGLIASGWHTSALLMRMIVNDLLGPGSGSLGSPGADEVRWLRPVRPGDILTARAEVLETRPLASKPDRGLVKSRFTLLNDAGETVMTFLGLGFFRRREAG
jgi:acyl dehydratase